MLLHGNARLTPFQRLLLCVRVRDEGWTVAEAAEAAGCSERTAYRWLARHDRGEPLTDRSSVTFPRSCGQLIWEAVGLSERSPYAASTPAGVPSACG
jgi:leucine-zipper of insertion element IS481